MTDLRELTEALRSEVNEIAEYVKQQKKGMPDKILLTPAEAASVMGFTEAAFLQAEWVKEIAVVKIGIRNFYQPADLKTFAANHRIERCLGPQRIKRR